MYRHRRQHDSPKRILFEITSSSQKVNKTKKNIGALKTNDITGSYSVNLQKCKIKVNYNLWKKDELDVDAGDTIRSIIVVLE